MGQCCTPGRADSARRRVPAGRPAHTETGVTISPSREFRRLQRALGPTATLRHYIVRRLVGVSRPAVPCRSPEHARMPGGDQTGESGAPIPALPAPPPPSPRDACRVCRSGHGPAAPRGYSGPGLAPRRAEHAGSSTTRSIPEGTFRAARKNTYCLCISVTCNTCCTPFHDMATAPSRADSEPPPLAAMQHDNAT